MNVERTTDDPGNYPRIIPTVFPTRDNMAADRDIVLEYLQFADFGDISIFKHNEEAGAMLLDCGADKIGVCLFPVGKHGIANLNLLGYGRDGDETHEHGKKAFHQFLLIEIRQLSEQSESNQHPQLVRYCQGYIPACAGMYRSAFMPITEG